MNPDPKPPSFTALAAATGLLGYATTHLGPVIQGGEVQPLAAAISALTVLSGLALTEQALRHAANGLDWIGAHTGTGKSGTAKWGKTKELKKDLCKEHSGPFWGMLADGNKPAFIDFDSCAYVVGPSGSGKGHTVVVPMIFLIQHSKVIMDFKPELLAICKKGLESNGQLVIPLAPFGAQGVHLEHTYCLNPLDAITDNLFHSGGLKNAFGDAGELALQLYEEPPNAKGDDPYWRNGTRKILTLLALSICIMKGYDATLADIALLLDDPFALEEHLCSILGLQADGSPNLDDAFLFGQGEWTVHHSASDLSKFLARFKAKIRGLLKQMRETEKTFASLLEGAQQAIEPYGFGALSSTMGKTNFNIDAIKDSKAIINIFIVGDASRPKATEKIFGIMQWFIQLKIKRHPNKKVPVYFINDEASNWTAYGLVSLMTWGRGFGIRLLQIFQNFPAYEAKHGKQAVDVLNSESEIKLFLPGQRCDATVKRVVNMTGEQSVMVSSMSSGKDGIHESTSESGRPLITEDEFRRSKYGLLFVREKRVRLQIPASYSETDPLKALASVNPHHGKPFLKKTKLKLKTKLAAT